MTDPRVVSAMMETSFYPHRPDRIELVQTHISYVFIAGDLVFKVKKAVDFGFLDFRSLEKRRYYCHEEVRLNRRLAPETYLEVEKISEDDKGKLFLGEGGRGVVEYAVKMRKLPRDRMLKKLIEEGSVEPSVMDAVAKKLADFHKSAETGGQIDEVGGVDTIRRNHDENFEQTVKYIDKTIPEYQYLTIKDYIYGFLQREEDLLHKRVHDHRIRDCHGDLHLEHICLTDGIVIFDCIEFNERFRYEDVAAEVAFLAMDLDFNGFRDYGVVFVRSYVNYAEDREIQILLNFYKCYYAYVRGKVTSFRSGDAAIDNEGQREATFTAARYFDVAYRYAVRLEKPTLIILSGLMGTGKSKLAGNIASLLGAEIIRTDVLRKTMLNIAPGDRHYEAFGDGIYSEAVSDKTYEKAIEKARMRLREGMSVIIDASFRQRREREKARDAARDEGTDYFIVECVCPEEVIRERLESRLKDKDEPSDGRWDLFAEQKRRFEPISEIEGKEYIVIDTSGRAEDSAREAVYKIRSSR